MLLEPSHTGIPRSDRVIGQNRRIEGLTPIPPPQVFLEVTVELRFRQKGHGGALC
jgi:hypothetical protein